jgi:hypothetical protein
MLLPQSSAFAALKNRLNSVSSIGYLHAAPRTYVFPINIDKIQDSIGLLNQLDLLFAMFGLLTMIQSYVADQ